MPKRLASKYSPIVVLVVLIGAILCMSRYAENRKAGNQNDTKLSSRPAAVTPNDATKSKDDADKTKHHPDFIDTFAWPEGATVWALLLTLIVIAWQSTETRDAAKGAFLNAQAVINAERPWLIVTLEEMSGPGSGFLIRVKNKGRTPAMIMSARIGCIVAEDVEKLPKVPPYGDGSMVKAQIVIPEDEPSVGWFDMNSLNNMTGNKAAHLPWEGQTFIFGIVLYRDLLDLSQTKLHETRWIYIYYSPRGELADSVCSAGGVGVSHEYDNYS